MEQTRGHSIKCSYAPTKAILILDHYLRTSTFKFLSDFLTQPRSESDFLQMEFERPHYRTVLQPVPPVPDPSNTYKENRTFTLHEHPPPLDAAAIAEERRCILDAKGMILERKLHGRLSNCGNHFVQPLDKSSTVQIRLTKPLAVGLRNTTRFPQVWTVQSGDQTYVARIYDPLYIKDNDGVFDVFLGCAKLVVNESKAYELLERLQGNLVPRYIGCFLMIVDTVPEDYAPPRFFPRSSESVPIPDKRSVFVTLLQHIPGEDFTHGPEWSICAPHKAAIRRAACIAMRELLRCRIMHYDLAERNTILKLGKPSVEPFCDEFSCKLRWQTPTTLLRELHPTTPSPIAIIDFEDYKVWPDYNYPLIENGPVWFSKYWFS